MVILQILKDGHLEDYTYAEQGLSSLDYLLF